MMVMVSFMHNYSTIKHQNCYCKHYSIKMQINVKINCQNAKLSMKSLNYLSCHSRIPVWRWCSFNIKPPTETVTTCSYAITNINRRDDVRSTMKLKITSIEMWSQVISKVQINNVLFVIQVIHIKTAVCTIKTINQCYFTDRKHSGETSESKIETADMLLK